MKKIKLLPMLGISMLIGVTMPLFSCGQSDKLNFSVNNVKTISNTNATLELDWTPSDHSVEFSNFKFKYNNGTLEATNVIEVPDVMSRPLRVALTFFSGALTENITDGVLSFHCKDKTISKEYDSSVNNIIVSNYQPVDDDIIGGDFEMCSSFEWPNKGKYKWDPENASMGEIKEDAIDKYLKCTQPYSPNIGQEFELKFNFKPFTAFDPQNVKESMPVCNISFCSTEVYEFLCVPESPTQANQSNADQNYYVKVKSFTLNGKEEIPLWDSDDPFPYTDVPDLCYKSGGSSIAHIGEFSVIELWGKKINKDSWFDLKFEVTSFPSSMPDFFGIALMCNYD